MPKFEITQGSAKGATFECSHAEMRAKSVALGHKSEEYDASLEATIVKTIPAPYVEVREQVVEIAPDPKTTRERFADLTGEVGKRASGVWNALKGA
jgi:hypothetical protein